MAGKETKITVLQDPDANDEVSEIVEYLELNVGPVNDANKKAVADLMQKHGTAAVILTLISEMNQLDMVTALLQQSKDVLRKRTRTPRESRTK